MKYKVLTIILAIVLGSAFFGSEPAQAAGKISFAPSPVTIDEGDDAVITVTLDEPIISMEGSAYVELALIASNPKLTPTPATLTFTGTNWNTPQTFSLAAAPDGSHTSGYSGTVQTTADSNSEYYNNFSVSLSVTVTNTETAPTPSPSPSLNASPTPTPSTAVATTTASPTATPTAKAKTTPTPSPKPKTTPSPSPTSRVTPTPSANTTALPVSAITPSPVASEPATPAQVKQAKQELDWLWPLLLLLTLAGLGYALKLRLMRKGHHRIH